MLEEIRVENEYIYLMEQLESFHGKDSIGDWLLRNEGILTSGDRSRNIPEERKNSANVSYAIKNGDNPGKVI